jgi:hypothetical protein
MNSLHVLYLFIDEKSIVYSRIARSFGYNSQKTLFRPAWEKEMICFFWRCDRIKCFDRVRDLGSAQSSASTSQGQGQPVLFGRVAWQQTV